MTAAICSCHNVTKGAVIDAMADGHLALENEGRHKGELWVWRLRCATENRCRR